MDSVSREETAQLWSIAASSKIQLVKKKSLLMLKFSVTELLNMKYWIVGEYSNSESRSCSFKSSYNCSFKKIVNQPMHSMSYIASPPPPRSCSSHHFDANKKRSVCISRLYGQQSRHIKSYTLTLLSKPHMQSALHAHGHTPEVGYKVVWKHVTSDVWLK